MRQEVDWHHCYKVLGVVPGSDWKTVQAAYRRQAQTSHPDRFPDGSEEQRQAEQQIVEINKAYQSLSKYYKQNGKLPGERMGSIHQPNEPTGTHAASSRDAQASGNRPRSTLATLIAALLRRRVVKFALYGAIGYLGYQMMFAPDEEIHHRPPPRHVPVAGHEASAGTDHDGYAPSPSGHYIYAGTTMGEVHAIQGTPTQTIGSIWYYGNSYIVFERGVVKGWHVDPDYPLRIRPHNARDAVETHVTRVPDKFTIGSTEEEVLAIQGRPITRTPEMWDYGTSEVYFRNGRVVDWTSSPLLPLKATRERR